MGNFSTYKNAKEHNKIELEKNWQHINTSFFISDHKHRRRQQSNISIPY